MKISVVTTNLAVFSYFYSDSFLTVCLTTDSHALFFMVFLFLHLLFFTFHVTMSYRRSVISTYHSNNYNYTHHTTLTKIYLMILSTFALNRCLCRSFSFHTTRIPTFNKPANTNKRILQSQSISQFSSLQSLSTQSDSGNGRSKVIVCAIRGGEGGQLGSSKRNLSSSASYSSKKSSSSKGDYNNNNVTMGVAALAATATASTATTTALEEKDSLTSSAKDEQKKKSKDPFVNDEEKINENIPFPQDCMFFDTYSGVTIDLRKLSTDSSLNNNKNSEVLDLFDPNKFESKMKKSIYTWKQEGKKGIWIKIPTEHSSLIPVLTSSECGFDFHHAEKGLVILTKWLPSDKDYFDIKDQNKSSSSSSPHMTAKSKEAARKSRLPLGPTHQVGIGGVVLHPNDPSKILVVQEKTGPAAKLNLWKVPTGLLDPNEDISEAAVREMKEETSLNVKFDRILCFRQAHKVGSLRKSDMFFICLLEIDDENENGDEIVLKPQEEEIANIKWMSIDEFTQQQVWVDSPLFTEMHSSIIHVIKEKQAAALKTEGSSISEETKTGFIAKKLPIGFRPASNTVYISKL